MYKNLAPFIGAQNVFTVKNKTLYMLTILILAACFITGCEGRTSTKLLDVLSDPILDLNRTVTVTLNEKNGSGITGTAIFTEYVESDSEQAGSTTIRNFDVEIQNAVPGRRYTAVIYSGNSCDTLGSIWLVDGFAALSFVADEDGTGSRSYLVDLTIDTNPETDILGKVLVIHDLADGTQVSCGVINLTE